MRLLTAANEDPVLASWAAVIHQYGASANSDVSPYEHWEAFQELFSYGLITSHQYDNTDASRVFFSGRRPPWGEIQRVLDVLRACPGATPTEPQVSKNRLSDNPFDLGPSTAIEPRSRGDNALAGRRGHELPERQTTGLDMFSNEPAALRGRSDGGPMDAPFALGGDQFSSRGRLPCTSTETSVAKFEGSEIRLRLECHNPGCNGEQVNLGVDNSQVIGPDEIPGGQVSLIDAIFCGTCKRCNTQYHCSAGRNVPQDAFR
jgi:hypothetical protein